MPPIKGLKIATAASAERYQDRDDLCVVYCDAGTTAAGVFTQSTTAGAAVQWSRAVLQRGAGQSGAAQAMVVNAGNANVCTGERGDQAVKDMAAAVADKVAGLKPEQVFVASTGVIGEPLKLAAITAAINDQIDLGGAGDQGSNRPEPRHWLAFANAIKTTDTYPKLASTQFSHNGQPIQIAGVAKGSGMIEPDMATMLAFVFTDAGLEQADLQLALSRANAKSFNCITVDSDTSTSDTCLLFATGAASDVAITKDSAVFAAFEQALTTVMIDLAQQVVRDGEGAAKFITVQVSGAQSDAAAKIVAKSIANSPLVKTAIAGEDANWGRIIMAVGKTGEAIDPKRLSVSIGGVLIAQANAAVAQYQESQIAAHLSGAEISIEVDLGTGASGAATVWTCDLTHGYIDINADYRS